MTIDRYQFTTSGYIEVYAPDGTFVSRHNKEDEARESALNHSIAAGLSAGVHNYTFKGRNSRMSIRIIAPAGANNTGEPDTTPPLAPVGGNLSNFTASTVQVNWTSNSEPDINVYRVYKSTTSASSGFSLLASVANHLTSYTDTTYNPAVQSWYRLTAVDNATPGNESEFSSTFFDITAPGTPSIPTISNVLSTSFVITPPTSSAVDHSTWEYYLSTDNVSFSLQATQTGAYTKSGLTPGATYYVYVRDVDVMGNTSGPSATVTQATTAVSNSVWLSPAEIAALPSSGTAYTRLQTAAQSSFGTPDLTALDNSHDTNTLAGALYAAKTGDSGVLAAVQASLASLVGLPTSTVLELARALQAYIIAADLIAYRDPAFVAWVTSIIDANIPGHSTANSLRETAQRSANNWGCHARASLAAAAVYLDDSSMLSDVTQAQQEYIGTYTGGSPQMIFSSTSPDQDWHFDLADKAGVNRADAGFLSGVLPEEWRRDTTFDATTATQLSDLEGVTSTYLWEGIQGFIVAAVILHRVGTVPITSGSNAVERAIDVLVNTAHPAVGDDRWIPWLANEYLGTNYDTSAGIQEGKGMGWTDWTGTAGTGEVSSNNAARISTALTGKTVPFSYNTPADPVTTREVTVTSASQFNSEAAVSGTLIRVNSSFSGNISISANDIDVVMSNAASITGSLTIDAGSPRSRIRWTGGNILNGGGLCTFRAVRDILFQDVYCEMGIIFHRITGAYQCQRMVFLDTTFDSRADGTNQHTLIFQQDASVPSGEQFQDFILSNVKIHNSVNNPCRIQQCTRSIVVDCAMNMLNSSSTGFRLSVGCNQAYIADSLICGRTHLTYLDFAATSVTNATWENVTRYTRSDANPQAFANTDSGNTGTVDTPIMYTDTGIYVGTQPTYSPFTGINIPNFQLWSSLPDVSSYGAQR